MPMFSFTLIQKIEGHSDKIAGLVVEEIRRDPQLRSTGSLHCDELARRARDLLGNLGHWLVANDPEVAHWSEPLGRSRFESSIPLHELIRCLLIVKARLIAFSRQESSGTALQIYAEEELEHRVGRFFDEVIYYVAKGYESARQDSTGDQGRIPGTGAGDDKAKWANKLKFHATHNTG